MPKHLLSKQQVLEFFNPVLDGSTLQNGQIVPFSNALPSININDCNPYMEEIPNNLSDDFEECDNNFLKGAGGPTTTIAAFYINGKPLTAWSAQQGGPLTGYVQHNTMLQWQYLQQYGKQLLRNRTHNNITLEEINIKDLIILKMLPMSGGIGLNIHVKFKLNNTEIWGKYHDINATTNIPKFTSEDIKIYDEQTKITIIGRVWKYIESWFKPKSGIYKCMAKEVICFNNVGMFEYIKQNDLIEVLHADTDKITFNYKDNKYNISKPTYFWFNWYFEKK